MRGFSLVEVMVVLGIFIAVAGFTLFMGIDTIARGSAMSERDTLVSLLTSARTAALANMNSVPQGVRIDATSFTRFEGATYTADPSSYRTIARTAAVSVTGPTLPVDIIFTQLSATTPGYSTITLSEAPASYTVDVSSAGRIEW
ncbi:MAG: prepilin-type N-terminal cleavage/methylation domain-containing protein [Patescibacteria group bacterium]